MDKRERRAGTALCSSGDGGRSGLTREELRFIRSLFDFTRPSKEDSAEIALVTGGHRQFQLQWLLHTERPHLTTHYGRFRLDFPLEGAIRAGDSGLRIGLPRLYDRHANPRALRAPVRRNEVRAVEVAGRLRGVRVVNVSTSGMLVEVEPGAIAPVVVLSLGLPTLSEACAVKGEVVRQFTAADGRLALGIRFAGVPRTLEDAICAFVLRAHRIRPRMRLMHPESATACGEGDVA